MGCGALLIGSGGRWRLECPVPGRGAGGEAAESDDGKRGWSWRPPEMEGPPPLPAGVGGAYPPVPGLLCPSCLPGGYTLEVLGPVTVAGRNAIAVAPRRDVLGSGSAERPYDRIEVAVDTGLGGAGALLGHVPYLPGHGAAGGDAVARPGPLEPADGSPPPDEVLDLLYRSGEPRDLGATARPTCAGEPAALTDSATFCAG